MRRIDPELQRLVPITSAWHLYRFLRTFPRSELQLAIAREYCRLPRRLDAMVQQSANHFAVYDNRAEAFHDRDLVLTRDTIVRYAQLDPARRLVASLWKLKNDSIKPTITRGSIVNHEELGFEFVDYEVRPCRTTQSENESGGQYGPERDMFDVLLASNSGRLPIVGEIKANGDANPFLALIQSLTYAVAMSTEPQRERLSRAYPDQFTFPHDGPFIDICLFLICYPGGECDADFLRITDKLACQLLSGEMETAKLVRRIVCLECDDSLSEFSVRFCHGLQR